MYTYTHYIFFEKCVYDTLYVHPMYMKLSRGNILTEYYIAQFVNYLPIHNQLILGIYE